ncbi:mitochondrial import receptor subunit tom20 [Umbelopsis nana]
MKPKTVAIATLGTVAALALGYAIYFDQKRRNDPEFRRNLKREKKRSAKKAKQSAESIKQKVSETLEAGLEAVNAETYPTSVEEKEQFFMAQISAGETLCAQGEEHYFEAAMCFFRAQKVYPSPVELIMIYQKTVPEPVFQLVVGMMSLEHQKRQDGFYKAFPPEDMHVKIEDLPEGVDGEGKTVMRKGLVATQDFEEGDLIYVEEPIVSALNAKLEGQDFCNYCLKHITENKVECSNCDQVVFCSQACNDKAVEEYHQYLCTNNKTNDNAASSQEQAFIDFSKEKNVKYPYLIARFLATMVHDEIEKAKAGVTDGYSSWDHVDRFRYLELPASAQNIKELNLIKELLGPKVTGVDEFLTEERFLMLKGKILFNAYSVQSVANGEQDIEKSTELHRESQQDVSSVGSALYRATTYLAHSCDPNTKIEFADKSHHLTLKAAKPIKKGEELQTSYIQLEDKNTEQRRNQLAELFQFKCVCPKCESD